MPLPRLAPLIELTRLDRPVGIWLLLWPTLGALWLAAGGPPDPSLIAIFAAGAVVMRSAGCCVNDFADHDLDGHVARTRRRPLARGALRRRDALACFALLSLAGFALALLTNRPTVLLSVGAAAMIALYPFAKRFTRLPQAVLGVTFSWGIPMAFTAQTGALPAAALLPFAANALWTVAYDTEYAMADREFDRRLGIGSSALLFGEADRLAVGALNTLFVAALAAAGPVFGLGLPYYLSLAAAAALLAWQQRLIRDRDPDRCLRAFRSNQWVGLAVLAGTVSGLPP